jgi:hypothetical protein
MDDQPLLNRDDGGRIFQQVMAQFDAPAYVRRAHRVQHAWEDLIAQCRRQRDEWLMMVVIRLGTLRKLAGSWDRLLPYLANADQIDVLQRLWDDLKPDLQIRIERTALEKKLRRALMRLAADMDAFNRRWAAFLPTVDLAGVNKLRDDYNRYYVLEKECAVRSPVVARHGFRPLPPLTTADLTEALPGLPMITIRETVGGM